MFFLKDKTVYAMFCPVLLFFLYFILLIVSTSSWSQIGVIWKYFPIFFPSPYNVGRFFGGFRHFIFGSGEIGSVKWKLHILLFEENNS